MKPSKKLDIMCKEFREQRIEIFESADLSDCSFLVGPESDQKLIPGYKLILAISSPVFKAMFYGSLAEKNEPITIPDVHPAHFKILLNYVYRNEVELSSVEEAGAIYYCAKKFLLPNLQLLCSKYLLSEVNSSNVCQVFEFAQLFEDATLIEKVTEIMTDATKLVLNDPNFEKIKFSTLMHIFSLDKLCVESEMELIEAAMRYSEAQEKLKTQEETSDQIELPIQSAIEKIRFLTVTSKQFVESPGRDFFVESEAFAVLVNLASSNTNIPYPIKLSPSRESRVQKTMTKTLRLKIDDFRFFNDPIYSTYYYVCDFDFRIYARTEPYPYNDESQEKFLSVFLYCNGTKSSNWKCKVKYEVRLLSEKSSCTDNSKIFVEYEYLKYGGCGWHKFRSWKDVLDPSKGYIKEGAITLEACVTVLEYSHDL